MAIIKECLHNDPEFDLLREVAVKLRNQGTEIESFATLVRLREIVKEARRIGYNIRRP